MRDSDSGLKVAQYLIETQAVRLSPDEPFRWASGWLSPVYCDNRRILSFPVVRNQVLEGLVSAVEQHFAATEAIAAVATAGLPMGALLADRLGLPFCYVRAKPKEHGLGNRIEGIIRPERQVLVVEDLISTGGSSLDAVEALREAGAQVLGLLSLFNYGFPVSEEKFKKAGLHSHSLANLDDLILVLKEQTKWEQKKLELLERWRLKPESWKPDSN